MIDFFRYTCAFSYLFLCLLFIFSFGKKVWEVFVDAIEEREYIFAMAIVASVCCAISFSVVIAFSSNE